MRFATVFALGIVVAAMLGVGVPPALAQGKKPGGGTSSYQVVRLAFPDAAQDSTQAYGLNDLGNVVGDFKDASGAPYGFHYERSTNTYRSLGSGARARGVNQLDEIVGYDEIAQAGLYWSSPGAEPIPLLPLAGHTHARASQLNSAGIIIGSSFIPEDAPVTPGFRAAVAWYVNPQGGVSGPVELPFLAGDIAGAPNDLTELAAGVAIVIGISGAAGVDPLPVSWAVTVGENGLEVIGPVPFDGNYSSASPWRVNNFGDAVGGAAFAEGASGMPFLRRYGQAVAALPILPSAFSGSASGINDAGNMVGFLNVALKPYGVQPRAVLWPNLATVVDLNSLVSLGKNELLTSALRINSAGDILGLLNGRSCLLIRK